MAQADADFASDCAIDGAAGKEILSGEDDEYQTLEQQDLRSNMAIKKICFIGAGHVGAPSATIIALFNPTLHINVVDKSDELIRKWNSRHMPLEDEPGLHYLVRVTRDGTFSTLAWTNDDETVERPARKPNLVFSSDVEGGVREADMVFLCVETPTTREGEGAGMAVDTGSLDKAVEEVTRWAKEGVIVTVKSTVPVGMARRIGEMISAIRPGMSFEVLSNPEFLSEGEAVKNLLNPHRVLIGSSMISTGHAAASTLTSIYSSWVDPTKIHLMNSLSAELTKLAANAMLAQRLSSVNAVSTICEQTGADMADVQLALGSDPRIGSEYLQAGIGFGGSCFKKDILSLVHLAKTLNLPEIGDYWLQTLRMNHFQSKHFVQRVVSRMDGSLFEKKVAIFGWTFKKGTSDSRESRSVHVIKELLNKSVEEVAIFDPGCDPADIQEEVSSIMELDDEKSKHRDSDIVVHDNPYVACEGADAILILTDWDQFRCLPVSGRSSLVPPRDGGTGDAFDSASYFPNTDSAPSEVGLSLSKLRIRDNDETGDNGNFLENRWGSTKPEPPCPSDCKGCSKKPSFWGVSNDQVDWKRISATVNSPRWVFDGRNFVDIAEMEKLGFKVEAIGKAST